MEISKIFKKYAIYAFFILSFSQNSKAAELDEKQATQKLTDYATKNYAKYNIKDFKPVFDLILRYYNHPVNPDVYKENQIISLLQQIMNLVLDIDKIAKIKLTDSEKIQSAANAIVQIFLLKDLIKGEAVYKNIDSKNALASIENAWDNTSPADQKLGILNQAELQKSINLKYSTAGEGIPTNTSLNDLFNRRLINRGDLVKLKISLDRIETLINKGYLGTLEKRVEELILEIGEANILYATIYGKMSDQEKEKLEEVKNKLDFYNNLDVKILKDNVDNLATYVYPQYKIALSKFQKDLDGKAFKDNISFILPNITIKKAIKVDLDRYLPEFPNLYTRPNELGKTLGMSLLEYAVLKNDIPGINDIITYFPAVGIKIDIDVLDINDTTPLMMAVHEGNPDIVYILLKAGADKSKKNRHKQDACYWYFTRKDSPGLELKFEQINKLLSCK